MGKKDPRTLGCVRVMMSRLYSQMRENEGNPILPGIFETDIAQQAVAASMETTKREIEMMDQRKRLQDEYDRIYNNKKKIAESRYEELQRRLSSDLQHTESLQEAEEEELQFVESFAAGNIKSSA